MDGYTDDDIRAAGLSDEEIAAMLSMPALFRVYHPRSASKDGTPLEPGAPVIPEIPNFEEMDVDAIRAWARDNLGFAVRGNFGKDRAIDVVRYELRCKGWIA